MLCFLWIFKTIAPSPCPVKKQSNNFPRNKNGKRTKVGDVEITSETETRENCQEVRPVNVFPGAVTCFGKKQKKKMSPQLQLCFQSRTNQPHIEMYFLVFVKAMVVYPIFPREQDPPLTLWTIVIDAGSPPPTGSPPSPRTLPSD